MTINEPQARALAYLLHEIRPDWGITSLVSLIDKHRDTPGLGALVIAAATKAMEPTCQTPGPIFTAGSHWPVKAKAALPPANPCEDHVGQDENRCRSCWGDYKAGLRPMTHIGKHWTPPPSIYDQLQATEAAPQEAAFDVQETK